MNDDNISSISSDSDNNSENVTTLNNLSLVELRRRHRELDEEIVHLSELPNTDQIRLKRLKKQKLHLKDAIERMRSELIPDIDA